MKVNIQILKNCKRRWYNHIINNYYYLISYYKFCRTFDKSEENITALLEKSNKINKSEELLKTLMNVKKLKNESIDSMN